MKFQVTYVFNGKQVTKRYATMNTASAKVEQLAKQGIPTNWSPIL